MSRRPLLVGALLALIVWVGAFVVTLPDPGAGLWLDYVVPPLTVALLVVVARRPGRLEGWAGLAARLVVGGIWIWAGLLKLPNPAESIESVRAYDLLPQSWVEPIGYLLPALEVVLGLALVLGVMVRGAALISTGLLVVFVLGIASVWARGIQINCGCFGDGGSTADADLMYPWEIARDVALALLSTYVIVLSRSRLALDSLLFRNRLTLEDFLEPDDTDADTDAGHDAGQTEGSTA